VTVAIFARGTLRTGTGTAIWSTTNEAVTNVAVHASADLVVSALGVVMALVAWIVVYALFTITKIFVLAGTSVSGSNIGGAGGVLVTVVVHAGIVEVTCVPVAAVSVVAFAHTRFLAETVDDFSVAIGTACDTVAGVGDFGTDESVSFVASVALAVVVCRSDHVGVCNTSSVGVTVVDFTWVDGFAFETVSVVSGFTGAVVVVGVTGQSGSATSVGGTITVVLFARVFGDTFASLFVVIFVTIALVAWVEVGTTGVDWTDGVVAAVVDWLAVLFAVSLVHVFADAVVSHCHVDALGVFVASGFTG